MQPEPSKLEVALEEMWLELLARAEARFTPPTLRDPVSVL